MSKDKRQQKVDEGIKELIRLSSKRFKVSVGTSKEVFIPNEKQKVKPKTEDTKIKVKTKDNLINPKDIKPNKNVKNN